MSVLNVIGRGPTDAPAAVWLAVLAAVAIQLAIHQLLYHVRAAFSCARPPRVFWEFLEGQQRERRRAAYAAMLANPITPATVARR